MSHVLVQVDLEVLDEAKMLKSSTRWRTLAWLTLMIG